MESKAKSILSTWHLVDASLQRLQTLIEQQAFLRQIHRFKKYSHSSGKAQVRFFHLDAAGTALEWFSRGIFASDKSVLLADITEITEGNNDFMCSKLRLNLRLDPPELCFTVRTRDRALHIVAESKEERDAWIQAMRTLASDKSVQGDFRAVTKQFQEELAGLVEEVSRGELKLKSTTLEAQSLREDNQLLKDELAILKEKLQGKEAEEVRRELENYYSSLLAEKEQEILAHEKTFKNLSWRLQDLDTKYTANVFSLESRLLEAETKAKQAEADLQEFRAVTRQKLAEAVDAKAGQYLHSNRMLTSYISHLKRVAEDLEKELAVWKSAVYHFALVQYLEEHPLEDNPSMKEVLRFALDHLERHHHSVSTQRELIEILSQTRSLRSRQTLSLASTAGLQ